MVLILYMILVGVFVTGFYLVTITKDKKKIIGKKINIVELLKDCPKGMELDCTICNNVVTLEGLDKEGYYPIKVVSKDGFHHILTCEGCVYNREDAKCVIFPKGKTTWEGFVPPGKFKDGDIVATEDGFFIGIVKVKNSASYETYCAINDRGSLSINIPYYFSRLATEEEQQKLFDAIKANGYKWNEETKTLEKLPKFKVGDIVRSKINKGKYKIGDIRKNVYIMYYENNEFGYHVPISNENEDNFDLISNKFDITTLKPFDKVLVRLTKDGVWSATFFSHYDKEVKWGCYRFVTTSSKSYSMCIPYESNEHLVGTTDDCDDFYKTWENGKRN